MILFFKIKWSKFNLWNNVFIFGRCFVLSHNWDTICRDNPKPAQLCNKLFTANCHDDNRKSCILNGKRLSCLARDVDHYI